MDFSRCYSGLSKRRLGFGMGTALALLTVLTAPVAHAGFVTQQNLTAVYSQAAFGATPITVNFLGPIITITSVNYNTINSAADDAAIDALPGTTVQGRLGNGPIQNILIPSSPTDDFFFIDNINFCGGEVTGHVVGCAGRPGATVELDSVFAALGGGFGQQDEGHELGHNLGLQHCQDAPATCPAPRADGSFLDLMNAVINGSIVLTGNQATTVLASGLVQTNAGGKFINVQPIVFAPEPTGAILFTLGISLFLLVQRRQKRAADSNHRP